MKKLLLFMGIIALAFVGCKKTLELSSLTVNPNKTDYFVGDSVAPSDIEVIATYNDGSNKIVGSYTVSPSPFEEAGRTTVTVSYSEEEITVSATYDVEVRQPKTLTSISVSPIKTVYFVGDIFSVDDVVVTAFYKDETDGIVDNFDFDPAIFDSEGTVSVTITYNENGVSATATYEVEVLPPVKLVSIAVNPLKTEYKYNDLIYSTDIEVSATYSDGFNRKVTGFTISPNPLQSGGNVTVTVSYSEGEGEDIVTATNTYSVNVIVPLSSISVTPLKTSYQRLESVAESDIEVIATYEDGSTKEVTPNSIEPAQFTVVQNSTKVIVYYSENGINRKANCFVAVTPITYTVTFISGDPQATGFMASQTFEELKAQSLADCGYVKSDWKFIGWSLSEGGERLYGPKESITIDSDLTLYALWREYYSYLGKWPQTIKSGDVTVYEDDAHKKEVGMFTYYQGDDGEWYCKQAEDAYPVAFTVKYSNGATVTQGGTVKQWFKVEPIKWIILTDNYNETGKSLLVAAKGLISNIFYYNSSENRTIDEKTVYPNNYKHSNIRAWLNGIAFNNKGNISNEHINKGFLQTAFDDTTQNAIAEVVVDNSPASTNPFGNPTLWNNGENIYACENTNDKIFLLSLSDVTNSQYDFPAYNVTDKENDHERRRSATDFALATRAWLNENGSIWWYLRSPFAASSGDGGPRVRARYVNYDGALTTEGRKTSSNRDSSIVPALVY